MKKSHRRNAGRAGGVVGLYCRLPSRRTIQETRRIYNETARLELESDPRVASRYGAGPEGGQAS